MFQPSAASLPQAEIRAAIAAELGALLVDNPATAEGLLSVGRSDSGGIELTYRPLQGKQVRAIPEPSDSTDTPVLLALLASNLVRNEALELLPLAKPAVADREPGPAPTRAAPPVPRTPPVPTVQKSPPPAEGERRLFLMAGIGSGLGWSRGTPEMHPTYLRGTAAEPLPFAGTAPTSGYHVVPEIAYLIRSDVLVGGGLRLQHVLGATELHHPSCGVDGVCRPPGAALALLARVGWLQPLGGRGQVLGSVAAGIGRVRYLVDLSESPVEKNCGDAGDGACKDTVAGGLGLLGPGLGFFYALGDRVWAHAGLQLLFGFPRAMVNVDGVAGIAVRL